MNVKKHSKSLTKPEKRLVKDTIYDMHFARNEDEFWILWRQAGSTWTASPRLQSFCDYFDKQWVGGRFHRWQCFWSLPGSAKTNNPIEQFNRQIKRDYTLFLQLIKMARSKASYQESIRIGGIPVEDMKARDRYLEKGALLHVTLLSRSLLAFVLDGDSSIVRVFQTGIIDRSIPRPAKKKAGVDIFFGRRHNHRQNSFEIRDQPGDGLRVDIVSRTCPCKSFFKYNFCIHLIAALLALNRGLPGREDDVSIYNRRVQATTAGRPRLVGPALAMA